MLAAVDPSTSAPRRENFNDVREFFRAHEAYWDQAEPTKSNILIRAARLANDAVVAVDMQLERIRSGLRSRDPDALWKVPIDIEFLVASLWKARLAAYLARSAIGPSWTALDEFNTAVPDLKLMRDVIQHVDEYGRDGDGRRHRNPYTGERIGRRWLHTMQLGDKSFGWLGGIIDFDGARAASFNLLLAIRAARDETADTSSQSVTPPAPPASR